jgi:hypothetical protein
VPPIDAAQYAGSSGLGGYGGRFEVPGLVGLVVRAVDPARVLSAVRASGCRLLVRLEEARLVAECLVLLRCVVRGAGLGGGGLFASQRLIAVTATAHW